VALWNVRSSLLLACLVVGGFGATGCEELVESTKTALDGKETPLKEAELPNTSRLLNCCTNLMGRTSTKSFVADLCPNVQSGVGTVLNNYLAAKAEINNNQNLTAEAKTTALAELKTTSQSTLEPAAKCLLDQTIGKISLDGFLSPKDCEVIATTGALPQGKTCDDMTSAILSPASNP
jgi:hypothetical protein